MRQFRSRATTAPDHQAPEAGLSLPGDWPAPGPYPHHRDRTRIMALRKTMPTQDPQRAEAEPQHCRDYSGSRGGHVQTPPKPVPGTPKGH